MIFWLVRVRFKNARLKGVPHAIEYIGQRSTTNRCLEDKRL
jgi:hypothetical protein